MADFAVRPGSPTPAAASPPAHNSLLISPPCTIYTPQSRKPTSALSPHSIPSNNCSPTCVGQRSNPPASAPASSSREAFSQVSRIGSRRQRRSTKPTHRPSTTTPHPACCERVDRSIIPTISWSRSTSQTRAQESIEQIKKFAEQSRCQRGPIVTVKSFTMRLNSGSNKG